MRPWCAWLQTLVLVESMIYYSISSSTLSEVPENLSCSRDHQVLTVYIRWTLRLCIDAHLHCSQASHWRTLALLSCFAMMHTCIALRLCSDAHLHCSHALQWWILALLTGFSVMDVCVECHFNEMDCFLAYSFTHVITRNFWYHVN